MDFDQTVQQIERAEEGLMSIMIMIMVIMVMMIMKLDTKATFAKDHRNRQQEVRMSSSLAFTNKSKLSPQASASLLLLF